VDNEDFEPSITTRTARRSPVRYQYREAKESEPRDPI
jgi:hypothetical protein